MRHEHEHGHRHERAHERGGFGRGRGGRPGSGGRRTRRGEIRTAVLAALVDQPRHGYEIIQYLEDRTGGAWRPSPGSVYPLLQMLEDEGLARSDERDGKRVYELTEAGQAEARTRAEQADPPPWLREGADGDGHNLRGAVAQLIAATRQVGAAGTPETVERAVQIVTEARKQLYRLLAEE
jgi:DNA-binding PadR family transcriptional regulator